MKNRPSNHLYYGDNLAVLRKDVPDESIDLIYLDPPFNSNANYNILFKSPAGLSADAQIEAFEDSWHWNDAAADAFDQVARSGNTKAFDLLNAMRGFLGENDMMAYLAMMAIRLIELHRVLKPTGSLYLHCDPTASHYLKLLLDGVFGPRCFRNEIVWKRTSAHSSAKRFGPVHDVILFYAWGATMSGTRCSSLTTPATCANSAMTREKAPIGVFLTKAPPTGAMLREAAAVGRFEDAWGRTYPRLQIVTIADLFAGRRPDIPFVDPGAAFRRAGREPIARQAMLL